MKLFRATMIRKEKYFLDWIDNFWTNLYRWSNQSGSSFGNDKTSFKLFNCLKWWSGDICFCFTLMQFSCKIEWIMHQSKLLKTIFAPVKSSNVFASKLLCKYVKIWAACTLIMFYKQRSTWEHPWRTSNVHVCCLFYQENSYPVA